MSSRVRVTVLIDDVLSTKGVERGAFPAHGLGILIEGDREEGGKFRLLIDGGPSLDLLQHNISSLDVKVDEVDLAVATQWSYHHLAAILKLARLYNIAINLPPLPKESSLIVEDVQGLPVSLLPLESPLYNERAVLVRLKNKCISLLACSIYGVETALNALRNYEEQKGVKIEALVGGFNLSTFDTYGLRVLTKFAEKRGAVLIPLHSTSLETRVKICKRLGIEEIPGVGTQMVLET
ncbi:MAG: hypothetical protein NZ954_03955 [Thermofilaceae archaeon]|nr:hypothetical protein [Thermofilaceae archaeon]MCX8180831.1 hypothetical protein [Thermofilaceae archaeon]MDW8004617.1 hypothetical protein [Thermofilaceae archaeon]